MKQTMIHWREQALSYWGQRTPAERRALKFLGTFLVVALLAQLLWSLETSRRQQLHQLPKLSAQAETMRAMLEEWQSLQALSGSGGSNENQRPSVERRLPELGKGVSAQWNGEGELQVKGRVDFATWLRWSAEMQQNHRLILSRSHIVRRSGGVDVDASYRLASSAQ